MITEVAFVAIAVSDKDRARKFYQETLELKPGMTAMEGGWVEYRSRRDHDRCRLLARLGPIARRNVDRLRGGRYRFNHRNLEGARRGIRHGKNRNAGLLDGSVPRSGREQAARAQTEAIMNLESRNPREDRMNQESRKAGNVSRLWLPPGLLGSRFFPAFLLS